MFDCTALLKSMATALLLVVWLFPVTGQDDVVLPVAASGEPAAFDMAKEVQARWPYTAAISLPPADGADVAESTPHLIDFFVPPDVFDHARSDLTDLRIYAADGTTVPYALRILSPKSVRDVVPAVEFNRSEPDEGVHELTLDLQQDNIEHNEVLVETTGADFRRSVVIFGSVDGKDWKPLVSGNVLHFTSGKQTLLNQEFRYPNSRHRYMKIQVTPDPQATDGKDEFTFQSVSIIRQLDVPGETVTTKAALSSREPTRYYGAPGSRWIVDAGDSIPCEQLEVDVQDDEFARDVTLESESFSSLGQPAFYPLYVNENSAWQRRRGEAIVPMKCTFSEVQSQRLRLTVADYRNKPLTLTAVRIKAAARQIVFERPADSMLPLKLYFGNQDAELAKYDFARNLPEVLQSIPVRAVIGVAEANPDFVPPPKAFTERFPWLIYVALSSVSLVLGAVIFNLSKAAIENHDSTLITPEG